MAGANEAEQTRQEAEQAPRMPETATEQVADPATEGTPEQTPQAPGFGERGRMRRRARFLRKARELAYRDLGGLVFDLHRFGQRNDQLVLAKLGTLRQIDIELRELEEVLRDRRPVTVLREVGIAACPRCAAIHGSDDRFCPGCGLAFDAHADRPMSTAPVGQSAPAPGLSPSPPATRASVAPAAQPTTTSSPVTDGQSPPTPQIAAAAATSAHPLAGGRAAASPLTSEIPSLRSSPSTPPTTAPGLQAQPLATPQAKQAPVVKPTDPSPPSASPPTASPSGHPSPGRSDPDRAEEDEPTQILRPPPTAGT